MFRILCSVFCIFTSFSFANDYSAALLNIESIAEGQWYVQEINDKGQVLGGYYNGGIYKIFILDPKTGLTFIESKGESVYPLKINNSGQILGYGNNQRSFIWSKVLGIRWLEIPNSANAHPRDFNDLGQIIGCYSPLGSNGKLHPFMWDYGVVTDMGPGSEFSQAIEALGYHVMLIDVESINNKGELAGFFAYGKFNEKKKKYMIAGYKTFFWNGDLNILPLFKDGHSNIKINNHGVVLVNDDENTYIWDMENGLRPIFGFFGMDINDSLTILGYLKIQSTENKEDYEIVPAIWKNDCIFTLADLLGVSNLSEMASYLSDSYDLEKIDLGSYRLNNKGQIPCMGWIWGDSYPCLLEPVKRPEGLNADLNSFMDSYKLSNEDYKGSVLRYAIQHNNHDALAHLVTYGPSIYNDSIDCLFLAAESGNTEAITLMIESGWDINIRKKPFNETLLHQAARFGHSDTCQMLINLGLNCNDREMYAKQSPLYLTAASSINAQNDFEKKKLLGLHGFC